jgi:hypothetical protein
VADRAFLYVTFTWRARGDSILHQVAHRQELGAREIPYVDLYNPALLAALRAGGLRWRLLTIRLTSLSA